METNHGATNAQTNTHLLVLLVQGEHVVAQRILNVAQGGYRSLLKELAYRAVATDPARLAGRPWQFNLELGDVGTENPRLRCEAWLKGQPQPPLVVLSVPVNNFGWVGVGIAQELKLEDYSVHVAVPEPDYPAVRESQEWEDDDFAVSFDEEPELLLPTDFSTEPLGPREVVRRVGKGTWHKCVFERRAWNTFVAAAGAETEVERGWLASARMHLVDGACFTVVEELFELPDRAGQYYVHTQGREFFQLHRQLGPRLGGHLHLHPREVEGAALGPNPSGPDVTVAWNLEAASTLLPVLPIAMFGTCPETCGKDVAAHAFAGGKIREIDLEVVQ
ncbi:MAG: hypothetical protein ABIK89_00990 [Planctomycetota bacterium]